MAEKEPAPLQPALWQAKAAGAQRDGPAQPGQHLHNKHRDSATSLRACSTPRHAEGSMLIITRH